MVPHLKAGRKVFIDLQVSIKVLTIIVQQALQFHGRSTQNQPPCPCKARASPDCANLTFILGHAKSLSKI